MSKLVLDALQLAQQRDRVVVVYEAHGLARVQRAQRAEDRRVAEAAGDVPARAPASSKAAAILNKDFIIDSHD